MPSKTTSPTIALNDIRRRLALGQAAQCVGLLDAWLAAATPSDAQRLDALLLLSRAHNDTAGHAEEQLARAQQAVALAQAGGDVAQQARATCQVSSAYRGLGLDGESADAALQALTLARQAGDAGAEAEALFQAGTGVMRLGDHDEATRLYSESLARAKESGDVDQAFWALNNWSHLLGVQAASRADAGDRAAAAALVAELTQVVDKALAVARNNGNPLHEAYALSNLADAYIVQGDTVRARELIHQYADIARGIGFVRLLAYAALDEARLLRAQGLLDEAIAVLLTPEHRQHLVQNDDLTVVTAKTLYELYKSNGQYAEALRHLEDYAARQIALVTLRGEKQQRVLLARLDVEQARAAADVARLEAQSQRAAAAALRSERDLHRKASRLDPLTSVGNRRAADEDLAQRLQQDGGAPRPLSVALLDIDHFKRVNDTLGHARGDAVLVVTAGKLVDLLRGRDRVYRFGGEEFLLLLNDASPRIAQEVCERLRHGISAIDWAEISPGLHVTVSIGVTCMQPGDSLAVVLERADQALYRAKNEGRNRVAMD